MKRSVWELYWQEKDTTLGLYQKKEFVSDVLSNIKKYFKRGDIILDLGCGSNKYLTFLKNDGIMGVGLDISFSALSKNEISSVCACCEEMPFKDNTFNAIIAVSLFQYVKDKKRLLNEIKRVLKKDGILITITPNADSLTIKFAWNFLIPFFGIFKQKYNHSYYPFKNKEFLILAKSLGFEIVNVSYLPITYLALPRTLRPIFKKVDILFKEEAIVVLKKL